MIRQRHKITSIIYLCGDLVATAGAFFAAWYLRFETGIFAVAGRPEYERYLALLPVILVLWPVVYYFHGLYQVQRGRSRSDEAINLIVAIILASLLLSFAVVWMRPVAKEGVPYAIFGYSRGFLALLAGLNAVFGIAARNSIRLVLRRFRLSGHNLQRILIVGAGTLGREVARKLIRNREFGFQVVGFLDDDPGKADHSFEGVAVLGTLDAVDALLQEQRIDQVFIALPLEAHRKTLRVLRVVGRECVEVRIVPDVLQYATLQAKVEDLDGTPVINLSQVPLQGWGTLVKRGLDLAVATAMMAVALPFFPLVALLIWIEDRGPIFYHQERMGLDGRPFQILKLRSMRVGAESSTGPVWAIKDDPRRTRVGAFLRRWSLDELPQLWNVFRGHMSIVGPRPERPAFVHEFKEKLPLYMLRHKVKSGITGWAQVHGWRGNTSIKKRLQYDLYYIENWSLKLDLKILWMTLLHGLRHNAY
ncbi:MAG: undecaprenyl-phosphate glucose phosphotransferase [Acidobacteriota bacterium]|nr:undecaprenyl-phosphate glucose phosphotransferase [Acidobacteriota bacterium]